VQDQDHTTALPGLAGSAAAPASSALIMRARAFRAWLVGAPDSLAAQGTSRYRLSCCRAGWVLPPWRRGPAAGPFWSQEGPGAASDSGAWGAPWSWAGPAWSSQDQAGNGGVAGPGDRLPSGSAADAQHVRQRGPRTRSGRQAGRQDTTVVMGHGARAAPA